ncbi:Lcl C-terminal domain-containing protein [Aliivibrio wodanis]|uniref:Lcl C-terminal domain-containing protein n=1 Tax=Aliivibrio wodanis TaxID=80852 RepID=UPI00406D0DF0
MKNFIIITFIALFSSLALAQECSIDLSRSAPNARYTPEQNGTVKDHLTGLTWMRCPVGKEWNSSDQICEGTTDIYFWQSALTMVEAINDVNGNHKLHQFAGITKWRMPNIKELISLKEIACHSPAVNTTVFDNAFNYEVGDLASYIWSNTPVSNGEEVYSFETVNAEIISYNPAQHKLSVLLVAE